MNNIRSKTWATQEGFTLLEIVVVLVVLGVVVGIAMGSVLIMNLITPGALDAMVQTVPGQIVLIVAGSLFVLGHVIINRITRIEA